MEKWPGKLLFLIVGSTVRLRISKHGLDQHSSIDGDIANDTSTYLKMQHQLPTPSKMQRHVESTCEGDRSDTRRTRMLL